MDEVRITLSAPLQTGVHAPTPPAFFLRVQLKASARRAAFLEARCARSRIVGPNLVAIVTLAIKQINEAATFRHDIQAYVTVLPVRLYFACPSSGRRKLTGLA